MKHGIRGTPLLLVGVAVVALWGAPEAARADTCGAELPAAHRLVATALTPEGELA